MCYSHQLGLWPYPIREHLSSGLLTVGVFLACNLYVLPISFDLMIAIIKPKSFYMTNHSEGLVVIIIMMMDQKISASVLY